MRRVKMQLKWTEIFIFGWILNACAPEIISDGVRHTVQCNLKRDPALTIMWLRATEKNGIEFIVSYKRQRSTWKGDLSKSMETPDGYSLTIKSFDKQTDSGIYNCATVVAYNALTFGKPSVLEGVPDPTQAPKKLTTTPCTTAVPSSPCVCPNMRGEKSCESMIWAPLAGSCGLLLVLLIAVSRYCNSEHRQAPPKSDHLSPNNDCDTEVFYDLHADISL